MSPATIKLPRTANAQPIIFFDRIVLERLTKSDVILSRVDAGHGIQVVSQIDSNRTDRSCIAQAHSHGVGVIAREIVEVYGTVNIPPVVKHNTSQILHQPERKTYF